MKFTITSTGWWGIPGSTRNNDSKVHAVASGKPICGAKFHRLAEYQWCAHGLSRDYVDCASCLRVLRSRNVVDAHKEATEEVDRVRDSLATLHHQIGRLIVRLDTNVNKLRRCQQ